MIEYGCQSRVQLVTQVIGVEPVELEVQIVQARLRMMRDREIAGGGNTSLVGGAGDTT